MKNHSQTVKSDRIWKRGDIILIALLLLLCGAGALLGFAGMERASSARICVDGVVVAELPLDKDVSFTVECGGFSDVVEIKHGAAFMRSAGCPDGVCVAQGEISRAGECIVCLPGKVTVTITGEPEAQTDAMSY